MVWSVAAAIMPISPLRKRPDNAAGFSLLELVVVLAIMAIMMSLVGTRMVNTIESARFIRTAEAAVADILIVRADAMMSAEARAFVTHSTKGKDISARRLETIRRFDVPEDWTVEGDIIDISASGVCSGGYISMRAASGRKAVFRLDAPKCEPHRVSISASE